MKSADFESSAPAPVPPDTWRDWANAIDRFLFRPADTTIPSLMRIFCGLVTLYVHLSYGVALLAYVGPNGWVDKPVGDWMRHDVPYYEQAWEWQGQPPEPAKGFITWSVWYHLDDPVWIWTVYAVFIAAMACYTVGFCTRVSGVITWIATLSFTNRIPNLMFGMDAMMVIVQTYLLIVAVIAANRLKYSVDAWLAKRRFGWWRDDAIDPYNPPKSITANFAMRCMQIHFCFVYGVSGLSKLQGTSWWSGDAVWHTVANPNFSPMQSPLFFNTLVFIAQHRWLYHVVFGGAVFYTLFLEIGFPALVWPRRTRWVMICGSVLLHTGIGFLMGLGGFSMFMLIMLMAFIPPEAARAFLHELGDHWRGVRVKYMGRLRRKPVSTRAGQPGDELAMHR